MKSVSLATAKLSKAIYVAGFVSMLLLRPALGQSTGITYQGRLNQNGSLYTGTAEFQATLWDSMSGGTQLQTNNLGSLVIGVTNGLFTLPLEFGDVPFNGGADRWLELQVRTALGPFTTLTPRQKLTPSPYAIHAATANVAATATSVPAGNVVGTLSLSQLPTATLTNNQSGVNLSGNLTGTFSGNGGNLTNISVNSLSAVATGASVTAWGWDDLGQTDVPAGLSNVVAVSAGTGLSLALKSDGTVVEWGTSGVGQLGVPPSVNNVMAIAAGVEFNLALKTDGTVLAWGNNDNGQTNVPPGLSNVTAIAAGYAQALALKSDGTVVLWGAPTNIPPGLNNISAIAAGYYHGLVLQSNGTIVTWTIDNSSGQTNVPPGLTNVVAIAAGAYHSLALKANGTVVAWGDNSSGQTNVPPGLTNVVAIAGLFSASVALKSDGTVVAWGDNANGEASVPVGLDNVLALGPSSMAYHMLVLRKQVSSPVAWLDSDNTFNGNIYVNGSAHFNTEHVTGNSHFDGDTTVGGMLTTVGELQLQSALRMNNASNLYFNFWGDSGLGYYGGSYSKMFAGFEPDGPVLFGGSGGVLGTTSTGEISVLSWNYQKRVGIGTTSPGATLDVRGDIKFGTNGQYSLPATEENLRMLRGIVAAGGTPATGSVGFSSSRTSTGVYAITFTTPFTGTPAVTATAADALTPIVATVSGLSANGVTINIYAATNGVRGNVGFYFTAIGPR